MYNFMIFFQETNHHQDSTKTESSLKYQKSSIDIDTINTNNREQFQIENSNSVFTNNTDVNFNQQISVELQNNIKQNSDNSDNEKDDYLELIILESSRRAITHRNPIKIKLTDSSSIGLSNGTLTSKNSVSVNLVPFSFKSYFFKFKKLLRKVFLMI